MIEVSYSYHDRNGEYISIMGTSIYSLLKNTKSKVRIHILHDETANENNLNKLTKMVNGMGHVIVYYRVGLKDWIKKLKGIRIFSPGSIMRLYLPTILDDSIKKVIHMDADTLINVDIKSLWDVDLENVYLAAVTCREARGNYDNGTEKAKTFVELGFNKYTYFNSGVLLLDLAKIRKNNLKKEAEIFLNKYSDIEMPDQDFLNYVFDPKKVKLISNKYNLFVSGARKFGYRIKPYIYHFAGENPKKPTYDSEFSEFYRKMYKETPWGQNTTEVKDREGKWIFPWHMFSENDKVIILGSSSVGKAFYEQSRKYHYVEVACVVDVQKNDYSNALLSYVYDYVLIATEDKKKSEEIRDYLLDMGIDKSRIKWDGNSYSEEGFIKTHLKLVKKVEALSGKFC